eukprot:Pgem_evm1s3648
MLSLLSTFLFFVLCTIFISSNCVLGVEPSSVSCPVCKMAGDENHQFKIKGNQVIYACNMGHEVPLYENAKSYLPTLNTIPSNQTCVANKAAGMTCPVCGMAVDDAGCFPNAEFDFGQKIHTCSNGHASEVFNNPNTFEVQDTNSTDEPMCKSQSVMWGGFMFTNSLCVTLWFESWVLNNEVKLAFGCIGVFFLAVLHEVLSYVRRRINRSQQRRKHRLSFLAIIINSSLFVLCIGIGYFLMLVAMTYNAGLFLCVLGGLLVGNIGFSWLQEYQNAKDGKFDHSMAKMADPCCDGGPDFDLEHSSEKSYNNNADIEKI